MYTHYKVRMPQENKTIEKMIKEILINLENIKENPRCLDKDVKEINSKISIFEDQQTPPQRKPEENDNIKSLIEYLEKNHNYL